MMIVEVIMKRLILALCTLFLAQSLQAADKASTQGGGTSCADAAQIAGLVCQLGTPRKLGSICNLVAQVVQQECRTHGSMTPRTMRRKVIEMVAATRQAPPATAASVSSEVSKQN